MFLSLIGIAVGGALFGAGTLAASIFAGAVAFAGKLAWSYLTRPKKRAYSAVSAESQIGGDVPVNTIYGTSKVRGHRVFYGKYGEGNKYNAEVFVLANGWCDGLDPDVYFYGEKQKLVPRAKIGNEVEHYGVEGFDDLISIRFYDGRPGQTADMKLVNDTANLGKTWKATSVCAGLCYVVVEREWNEEKFKNGRIDIDWVLRGLREYDPRKDSTVAGGTGTHRLNNPATWQHTLNPAVHRLNYQLGLRGLVSGRTLIGEGKSLGQLDLGTYFVAMNASDTLRNGKPTYQCSLFVTGDDDHTEILKEFDDAMAGYGLNRSGLSGVIPGAPQIPVREITADDLPLDRVQEVQRRKSAFELFNHLSGQFTSKESQWQPESLKPIVVNADVAADGRARGTSNDFLQVTDPDIAQYLLNIRYRQNRKGGKVTLPVSRRVGLAVQEGEWVTFDGTEWLVSNRSCDEKLRFSLELAETGADIYDDGDIEPGPIVIPPTPPINPSLASTVYDFDVDVGIIAGADGLQRPSLKFTWTPPNDPTITAVRFFYRPTDETDEFEDRTSRPQAGIYITSKDVESGKQYVARATISTRPDRFKTFTPWMTTPSVTGRQYADVFDNSITVAKLADAAVTAAKLMDEAVTSIKLADQAVSEAKIALQAVSSDKIKDLAVTNEKIVNDAISEAKLQPSAVTSGKIADAAITAAKLANGSVSLTKFASGLTPVEIVATLPTTGNFEGRQAMQGGKLWRYTEGAWKTGVDAADISGTIVATEIADDSISTPKLKANAVTAAKIASGAITTDKLDANSVTTAKLAAGAVTATELAAGAVTAQKVAAYAITTGKLVVADFSNLVPNPVFDTGDLTDWNLAGSPTSIEAIAGSSLFQSRYACRFNGSGGIVSMNSGERSYSDPAMGVEVKEGEVYFFSIRTSKSHFGITPLTVRVIWVDAAGAVGGAGVISCNPNVGGYNTETGTWTVPAGVLRAAYYVYWPNSEVGRWWAFSNCIMRRQTPTELIVDGAVIADKIAANAITAAKIAAGSVTALELATNSVTAVKIATGAVTADAIAVGAITAEKIAAGTITGDKVAANTLTGDKMVANSITARELVITNFTNLVPNGNFATGDFTGWWFNHGGSNFSIQSAVSYPAPFAMRIAASDTGSGIFSHGPDNYTSDTAGIAVRAGEKYLLSVDMTSSATDVVYMYAYYKMTDGTYTTTAKALTGTSWHTETLAVTVPVNAVKMSMYIRRFGGAGATGTVWLTNAMIIRMADASLIVDGAITANHLTTNSAVITSTAQIANAVIATAHIQNLSVDTIKIKNNAVTDYTPITYSWSRTLSGGQTYDDGAWVTRLTVAVSNPLNVPLVEYLNLRARATLSGSGAADAYIRIRRGGIAIGSIRAQGNVGWQSFSASSFIEAGTSATYYIDVWNNGSAGSSSTAIIAVESTSGVLLWKK